MVCNLTWFFPCSFPLFFFKLDMKGKIRVYCRLRPLTEKEIADKEKCVVTSHDEFTVEHQWKDEKAKQYIYDHVFDYRASQENVFEDTKVWYLSFNICVVFIVSFLCFILTSFFLYIILFLLRKLLFLQPNRWFYSLQTASGAVSCGWIQCVHFCLWSNWFWEDIYNIWF